MKKDYKINNVIYVKIPNQEILENFKNLIRDDIFEKFNTKKSIDIKKLHKDFIEGIYNKNLEVIYKNLNQYLKYFSAYHLFVTNSSHENVYQVLLAQIFLIYGIEVYSAETESGEGKYDFGFPNIHNKKEL